MKKKIFISLILIFFYIISAFASTMDYRAVLGFSGLYIENSWTPLIIRISNEGPAVSGYLIVESDNSSTATEQIRKYTKRVDLPSGALKEFSFVIPVGHHNKDIRYYFESGNEIYFEEIIQLKQKGVKNNFILGISPYPDLGFLINHELIGLRNISYPHIDNLPQNSNAYDSVDFISIHRELWDKLSNNQFQAITGWVNKGGVLVVWGGKSPSPSKWNYLPSEITGLKRIEPNAKLIEIESGIEEFDSILVNKLKTESSNRLLYDNDQDLVTYKSSGSGSVFLVAFDYSGNLRNWKGIDSIWNLIFQASEPENIFQKNMKEDFLLEDYITLFDNSGFTYLDRNNVALILFLSASASISMLIFIHFRKKSKNISLYISGMILFLLIFSILTFISIFNDNFRNDSFIISSNVIYHHGDSERSVVFKDMLIGSNNKSNSDIIIHYDSKSIVRQDKYENLILENSPELILKNISLNQWSSKIFRLESSYKNLVTLELREVNSENIISINNLSDYFIQDTFVLLDNQILLTGSIMPDDSLRKFNLNTSDKIDMANDHIFSKNPLNNKALHLFLNQVNRENQLIFGGFMNEELYPLEFTNKSWKEKSSNIILYTHPIKGDVNE